MKLTIGKQSLQDALEAVQNVVGNKVDSPVLASARICATPGRLEFTATDLTITITTSTPANVTEVGSAILPAKKLFAIIRDLGPSDVEIRVDDKFHARIKSGKYESKLLGGCDDVFPPTDKIEGAVSVRIGQEALKQAFKRVSFAVYVGDGRPELTGIFMSFIPGKKLASGLLDICATDGRRMSFGVEDLGSPVPSPVSCILPARSAAEVSRLLGDLDDVEMLVTKDKMAFAIGAHNGNSPVRITTKLMEGSAPNIKAMVANIPPSHRAFIPREEFQTVISRVAVMTNEQSFSIKLAFTKNHLEISANAPDVGDAAESLDVRYDGPDVSIAFNPIYLTDALKATPEHMVYFDVIDDRSPIAIRTESEFFYILLPVRLS